MASDKKKQTNKEVRDDISVKDKKAEPVKNPKTAPKKSKEYDARNTKNQEEERTPSKKPDKTAKKESDLPRSSKLIHQFLPFIFFALAILIATCLITVEIFHAEMGIAGKWISMIFCGLFGAGAFALPIIIIYIGAMWQKIVDEERSKIKPILASIAMLLIAIFIHIFFTKESPNFNIVSLWNNGVKLMGGGVISGLICEGLVVLFDQLGTTIITVSCLAIALMFLFNLTPKNIWTYIRYKRKLSRERNLERRAAARERREEESERMEREGRAEEIRRKARENRPEVTVAVPETTAPAPEKKEASQPAARPQAEDPMLAINAYLPKTEEPEPEPLPLADPAPEAHQEDDDGVQLEKIFHGQNQKNADGIIAIDLPAKKETSQKSAPEIKTTEVKAEPKPAPQKAADKHESDVVLSMKVDTEALSELESLRGGDGGENVDMARSYVYPPTNLLHEDTNPKGTDVSEEMNENAAILRETLASFNIGVKDQILCSRGPTITRYELRPEVGVRVRSIANLVDDISLSLATSGVRIEAPIPNKPYVGIEVPNRTRLTVFLRTLIEHEKFVSDSSKLAACLGADVGGNPVFFDITKMPHLLIAGATGMGKSVCINSIIMSILYKASPDEVKLILIDPKKVEFNIYKDIPHLYAPIVSDPKKAAGALASAVAEMERRFELIEDVGVRDINNYNAITADDPDREYLPKMVIIIDELADLMMTAPGEVESSICRLAQKARAAGIHIIIGTQRPSVDVITGLIKANVPSRIACTVASQVDSRTIIDIAGAEKLIGRGDMLFAPVGISKPMRVQGAFVSDAEVEAVVEFIKANNNKAEYNKDFISIMESEAAKCGNGGKKGGGEGSDGGDGGDDNDPKFREAVKLAIDAGKISTSLMQRMLGVGYGRAAKIIDRMEDLGYVSAPDGNKPRRVLITMQEYMEKVINDDIDSGEPSNDPSEDEE